jgi:hypothetical protein
LFTATGNKKLSLLALIFLITLAHIGILSLRFEWPTRTPKNKPDFNTGIFTAELVGKQPTTQPTAQPTTPKTEAVSDQSKDVLENETVSSPPKKKRRAFSMRSSDQEEAIDSFVLSQKIRQQLIQDEQRSRRIRVEGAITELQALLFFQGNSAEKNCCKLVLKEDQAECTNPATTLVYKQLANSLMQRLVALSDQGISVICNSESLN